MSEELSRRVEADIQEIMERTGFDKPHQTIQSSNARMWIGDREIHIQSFQLDWTPDPEILAELASFVRAATLAFQLIGQAIGDGFAAGLFDTIEEIKSFDSRATRRYLRAVGLLDPPPQYNFRQTKRGRVPRLTPAMRAKKRELRERRRRR